MINTIKKIALILDDQEAINNILDYEQNSSTQICNSIKTYIALANFVIKDIASNFLCYKKIEQVISNTNKQIELADLDFQPCTIKGVKHWSGRHVKYLVFTDFLIVPYANEQYTVEYTYFPEELDSIDDDLPLPVGLDDTAICYGVIYEYYIQKMLFNEAAVWEQKYKNCLKNLTRQYAGQHFLFRGLWWNRKQKFLVWLTATKQ